MKLNFGATITGADDHVDPRVLLAMSEQYPRVEWGVLLSSSRQGSPRYPSLRWVRELCEVAARHDVIKLSAHLCGDWARQLGAIDCEERFTEFFKELDFLPQFGRVQVNGYEPSWLDNLRDLGIVARMPYSEWILQCRDVDKLAGHVRDASQIYCASVLADPSGGRGVALDWPIGPTPPGAKIGYAGGIGPHNVGEVVSKILGANRGAPSLDTWVDVESGARDARGAFSFGNVVSVLEEVDAALKKMEEIA